jgi:type 2A phosphatase activator TIP41
MPHSFFILSRLFLRVDNVLFRTHDVRVFHAFGSDKIIREVMGRECAYTDLKSVSRCNFGDRQHTES